MSGETASARAEEWDGLEAAIAENPDAVAAFVRRLDAVNELLDVVALGENALTDEMVVELAATGSTLAESADGLATDETVALAETVGTNGTELRGAVETLADLQRSGTLDELADLAAVGSLVTAALTDEMVASLASAGASLGELADTAADPGTREALEGLLDSIGAAERDEPRAFGPLGVLRALRDPDVRYGLGYVIGIARAIGSARRESKDAD